MKSVVRHSQLGFSLMELVVSIVVIGVLGSVFAPYVKGTIDNAKATAIDRVATDASNYWKLANQACNTSSAFSGNVLPDTSKTVADVIFGGVSNVASSYKSCFGAANVTPLTDASQPGASAGTYNVKGFAVTFSGGGTAAIKMEVAKVPDTITLPLARIYNPNVTDPLPTSDTTGSVVQFGTLAADNTRTVTIIKQ